MKSYEADMRAMWHPDRRDDILLKAKLADKEITRIEKELNND